MPDSPTSEFESAFICDCEEWMHSACAGKPFYKEHQGKRYCVFHFPGKEKIGDFETAIQRKIENEDFDFCGAWFPKGVSFDGFYFGGAVNFSGAHFEGVADFQNSHFESNAKFRSVFFNADARFNSAKFRSTDYDNKTESDPYERHRADFSGATFNQKADFSGVHFFLDGMAFPFAKFCGDADFSSAYFQGDHISAVADFDSAVFEGSANFSMSEFDVPAKFTLTTFSGRVSFLSAAFSGSDLALPDFTKAQFLQSSDFRYAKFNHYRVIFTAVVFSQDVTFRAATFEGGGDFIGVRFVGSADFSLSRFHGHARFKTRSDLLPTTFVGWAYFEEVSFANGADFRETIFCKGADFGGSYFLGDADFSDATFAMNISIASSVFSSYLRFSGENNAHVFDDASILSLEHARIKNPEHISFHALQLRPNWFINVDVRKFELIEIDWVETSVADEIGRLLERGRLAPYRDLSIAFRGLAVNAEDNHRYEEASRFRYMAMEARRLERWRGFAPSQLSWWYWLASGYGERVLRAFLVLIGIWFFAGILNTQVGFARWEPKLMSESDAATVTRDTSGAPLSFKRALTYSLGVMTLQKPEPKPATTAAQTIVLFETILGPVQAALLALAIRRKFMR